MLATEAEAYRKNYARLLADRVLLINKLLQARRKAIDAAADASIKGYQHLCSNEQGKADAYGSVIRMMDAIEQGGKDATKPV